MFFVLILVANGHLRRNASTFRNDSGAGINGTGLKIDDTKLGPNSSDSSALVNDDIGVPDGSKENGTNFWTMSDDTIEETNETDPTQTEENTYSDGGVGSVREIDKREKWMSAAKWNRSLTREDFCGRKFNDSGSASASNASARSYIIHLACPAYTFGVGATSLRLTKILDIAVSQDLTMVCQPGDWGSGGHQTGNVGDLFGCFSDSKVEGNFATLEHVCNDPSLVWESVGVRATGKHGNDVQQNELSSSWRDLRIPKTIQHNRVYVANHGSPCDPQRSWGTSWRFFESQYHLIREKDKNRMKSSEVSGFSIVAHIRRGDAGTKGRGYSPQTYVSSVDALLRLSSNDNSNETRTMAQGQPLERLRKTFGVVDNRPVTVTVLAEEDADQQDAKNIVARFEELKEKYPGKISETRYFFGKPEKTNLRLELGGCMIWINFLRQIY